MYQPANYNRLAKYYSFCEYLTFGGQLQRCRFAHARTLENKTHVLLLGDGNGRFSTHLLFNYPNLQLTSLDASQAMLNQAAKRRLSRNVSDERIHNLNQDVLEWEPPRNYYDAVVAQFFFDSFDRAQVEIITSKITSTLKPNGMLLVSDFHIPQDTRIGNKRSRLTLSILYMVFKVLTGLRSQKLVNYQSILATHGFILSETVFFSQKTLISQVFHKSDL